MSGSSGEIGRMRRVAAIATLANRIETFQRVLPVIYAQVDHVFIYLDGYSEPPAFLRGFDRVTVRRAEDTGDLHASSRFLCLQDLSAPTVVVIVDDDIIYPPDYVDRLVYFLQRLEGQAIVGVHGRIFLPPHESYVRNAFAIHFAHELKQPCHVHELGTGTCGFISSYLDVDPREWSRTDMDDIIVATEAQRRGLPRITVTRTAGWMKAHAEDQLDSLWVKALTNDSEQSCRMRALLSLYSSDRQPAGTPAILSRGGPTQSPRRA